MVLSVVNSLKRLIKDITLMVVMAMQGQSKVFLTGRAKYQGCRSDQAQSYKF